MIKSKDYAKSLAELIEEDKTSAEQKKLIDGFFKVLKKNGDMKKAKEIIGLAEKLYLQKTGKRKVIFETARKIKNPLTHWRELVSDVIEEKINPELVAGIKITINNEKQIDFSLKNKLEKIFG